MVLYNLVNLIPLFIAGCAFGSFLNVVIDRLSTRRSIFTGRSYCENCKKKIKDYDLIPVVSFLFLHGRCRFCKHKIPQRILFVEILTGIVFALTYLAASFFRLSYPELIYILIVSLPFIAIFFADLDYGIIPDQLSVFIVLCTLPYLVFFSPQMLLGNLVSAFVSFLLFLFLYVVTRGRGMGFGDVKLAFVIGLFLGFPKIIAGIYLAFLTGAILGIILIILGKKKLKKDTIPFGPFLAFSALISYFFGKFMFDYFVSYLNI